jgi:NAD(P)H dehydrogenase (quinone)
VRSLKVLIVYDSRTRNTEEMAFAISKAVEKQGLEPVLRRTEEASVDELPKVQALILGSPVYYGQPTAKVKQFIDESIKYHGKLTHLVGGAFCSAGGTHTGSETTILSLLESMLVHGMIIQGNPHGNHYGPASVGAPDDKALEHCEKLAERVCNLVKKLNQ